MKRILFLVVAVIVWAGCSTDVELNAPYNSETVVFGLLDPTVDTQWVKINRTFLTNGNNLDIALIQDSSEYQDEDINSAVVEEWINGNLISSFALKDTLLENKDPDGIFYAPFHKAYYFESPSEGLNDDADYRLNIDFANKEDVSATTDLIQSVIGNITQPPVGLSTFKFNWATVTPNGTTYNNYTFKWSSTPNAKRYEAGLRVTFVERLWEDLEHTVLVEEKTRTIFWDLGTVSTDDSDGGQQIEKQVNGESFFRFLRSKLEENPFITRQLGIWDEVDQITRAFDFVLTVSNEELSTYLNINEPVTEVIQERPSYTNINNGIGLFASRYTQERPGIGITSIAMEELATGEFTALLNFCTPNPFQEYYCGE